MLNSLDIHGVCARCKEQIDWRIKYKKYKPLSAPKKCVKCEQKTVKRAYTSACAPCGKALGVCVKCLEKKDLIEKSTLTQEEENAHKQRLEAELRLLPVRQRRALERKMKAESLDEGATVGSEEHQLSSSDDETDEETENEAKVDDSIQAEIKIIPNKDTNNDDKTELDTRTDQASEAVASIEKKLEDLSTDT